MVKEETKNNENLFKCEACGFYYKEKGWAKKCEDFCNKNKSCNIEITKHSVQIWNEKTNT